MLTVTKRFSASTFQEVFARLSIELPRRIPASEVPCSRRTPTSWCWWLRGWSGVRCRLWCTLMTFVPETTLVSSRTLSLPLNPLRLLTTSHVSILSFLASKFVIEVFDLHFSSPSSSTFDNWVSIFSDEFPCRTIPTWFGVDQTHVFSICTGFPEHHQLGSCS